MYIDTLLLGATSTPTTQPPTSRNVHLWKYIFIHFLYILYIFIHILYTINDPEIAFILICNNVETDKTAVYKLSFFLIIKFQIAMKETPTGLCEVQWLFLVAI